MRKALMCLLSLLVVGCDQSGTLPDDDDATAGDDDAADDDDSSSTDDDDDTIPGDDDDASADCSGGSGWPSGPQFLEVMGESYWVYVPSSPPPCMPLFLFGHGGNAAGGGAEGGMWNDLPHTNLPSLAESEGFVFMVPFVEDVHHTTHGWSADDVAPMEAMIEEAAARADIDLDHVIFAGTSAGGVMAMYWGLYFPDSLSHVGVLSAGFGGQVPYPDPEPDPKLPFFLGHDPDDEMAPYSLSEEAAVELEAHGHEVTFEDTDVGGNGHGWHPSVSEQILAWWLP